MLILECGCYNYPDYCRCGGVIVKLSHEEVLHIALLARLGMTEAEADKFSEQLSHILENFQVLQEVDTGDIPPTAQSIPLHNVVAEDTVALSLPPDQVLANAPRREDNLFRVRSVLE